MPPRVPAMRYHNRLSMKRRPQPSCGYLGCGTSIENPIRERSNITIPIVKLLEAIPPRRGWAGKAKGWFLEFRLIPVLLWSYTAVVLGTAVAFFASGSLNLLWFVVALALGALARRPHRRGVRPRVGLHGATGVDVVPSVRRRVGGRVSGCRPIRTRSLCDPNLLDYARGDDGPRRPRARVHVDARGASLSR